MATPLTPTPEQAEIIALAARRGPSAPSLLVEAGAGCAKTSTIKMAARGIRVPALAVAFNARIAADLKSALGDNFTTRTLNGLGHGAWARALAGGALNVDPSKLSKLVTKVSKQHKVKLLKDEWSDLLDLVKLAQRHGLSPDAGLAQWLVLADSLDIAHDSASQLAELGKAILLESIAMAKLGVISFQDQIYCPIVLGGKFVQFPALIVDEDQDLSELEIAMLGRSLAPGGRIFAVGDRRQAIYAWRGAAGDAARQIQRLGLRPAPQTIAKTMFEYDKGPIDQRPGGAPDFLIPPGRFAPFWQELPLMTSFRCPKSIVARQQTHVPGFRAAEGNAEGQVLDWATPKRGWSFGDLIGLGLGVPTILCRNNAPTISLAFKLIRRGIGVHVIGREIGRGLVQLLRKLAGGVESAGASSIMAALADWELHELALATANCREASKLESIRDRAESLRAVLADTEARNAGEAEALLGRLFGASPEGLTTLSSIHKAKGLEWPLVVHLDPWRLRQGRAKAIAAGDSVAAEQEANLNYVAETRAKQALVLANLEDFGRGRGFAP